MYTGPPVVNFFAYGTVDGWIFAVSSPVYTYSHTYLMSFSLEFVQAAREIDSIVEYIIFIVGE